MANIYKVCSGNTTISINCTLVTSAPCTFWYSVWQDYFNNQYYRKVLTLNLSQASHVPFTYRYQIAWTTTKNGAGYSNGSTPASVTIPAGVTTHNWYVTCLTEIGQPSGDVTDEYRTPQ